MSKEQILPSQQDPSLKVGLGELDQNYEAMRERVESAFGPALDESFQRNANFVVTDNLGNQSLTLYLPRRERDTATLVINSYTDQDGNRTVDLSFAAKDTWDDFWQYEDGPNKKPRLIDSRLNPETGKLVPKEKTVIPENETRPGVIHQEARDVAFWGEVWLKNLANGSPEKPERNKRSIKGIGKRAVNKFFNP